MHVCFFLSWLGSSQLPLAKAWAFSQGLPFSLVFSFVPGVPVVQPIFHEGGSPLLAAQVAPETPSTITQVPPPQPGSAAWP